MEPERAAVTITPSANGPFLVRGPFRLVDARGNEYARATDVVKLCRCGRSATKPFCDGSHASVGFRDE